MKHQALSHYLELINAAAEKRDYHKVKRLGETALNKLDSLQGTPAEVYALYSRLGVTYFNLDEYSRSLDIFYKAYSMSSKEHLSPEHITFLRYSLGIDFMEIRNIKQALVYFRQVERYYQQYGNDIKIPMTYRKCLFGILYIGFCYLYNDEIDKAREFIENELAGYFAAVTDVLLLNSYNHLKGEYYVAIKDLEQGRRFFEQAIEYSKQSSFPRGVPESQVHLVMIDVLEGKLESAIQLADRLFRETRRLKYNNLTCEVGLLLSRCYSLNHQPAKAAAIEKQIKALLEELDITWFYERVREFEKLNYQIQNDNLYKKSAESLPKVLTNVIHSRREGTPYEGVIVGNAPAMRDVYGLVEKVAPTELPVLIQGETGTGKDLFSRYIHQKSLCSNKPFMTFNCGTVPETLIENEMFGHTAGAFTGAHEDKKGYIEMASGGTLFIDEVANISMEMQQKLLRVLDDKFIWRIGAQDQTPVDTRFVFASNRNIEEMVSRKLFREDLYYRINVIVINLPPLRERKGDIPLLIEHFLRKYQQRKMMDDRGEMKEEMKNARRITSDALSILTNYPWPGNVRELENEMQRICVLNQDAKSINYDMLSEPIKNYSPIQTDTPAGPGQEHYILKVPVQGKLKELKDGCEREIILKTIRKYNGNVTTAARQLDCDRCTLHKRMRKLDIKTVKSV